VISQKLPFELGLDITSCCSTFWIDQCANSIHEPHQWRIRKYLDHFVQVFLDDILIYSKNEREHEEHLQIVLSYLRENKLYGKLSKCSFFQKEIHYLGHIISGEGISVDPEKVKAIMEWPVLKNGHEVRSFMGLAGYYQIFVEGFSKIAKPITTLQRKGVRCEWTEECDSAFIELKRLLTSAPIL
jgi:hypothetical protein